MKTAPHADHDAAPTDGVPTTAPQAEQHHGDLRKGAFLRRRADYQMQVGSPSRGKTGGVAQMTAAAQPPLRKPR